jgi:hypothetical protein
MRISAVRPMDFAAERNTVPLPTGPSLTLSAWIIRGLYRGSFRWSADKSNTASAGRLMTISPAIFAMSRLRQLVLHAHTTFPVLPSETAVIAVGVAAAGA